MSKKWSGEVLILSSSAFFSTMAALVKIASASFSGTFVALFRFVSSIVMGLALMVIARRPIKISHARDLALRGVFGAASMILYFIAIEITGSGRATLLGQTFPIFVALFGYLFFKEKVSSVQIVSIVLCVIGMGFVFYDGSDTDVWGNLLGLSVAMARGMAVQFIKKTVGANDPIIVYLSACVFGLVIVPFTIGEVVNVTWGSLPLLLSIGILGLAAQMLFGHGFKSVAPTTASILMYASIPLTVFLGYLTGEEVRPRFLIGTAIIIAGLLSNSGGVERLIARTMKRNT